jgi:DNA modification methylase
MRQTSITRMIGKNVNINWKPALWYVRGKLRRDISTAWPQDMITPRKPEKSLHPWQQAESWFSHWIEQLTLPGEIVIDPFMGSGTTLVAAKELKRKSIGMEIDEKYCKIAVDRLRQGILLAS